MTWLLRYLDLTPFWNDGGSGSLARIRIFRRQEMITRNKNEADNFFVTISWHGWRVISCACESEWKQVTDTLGETWKSQLMRRNHYRLLVVSWSSTFWTLKPQRSSISEVMSMPIVMKSSNATLTAPYLSSVIGGSLNQPPRSIATFRSFCASGRGIRCKRRVQIYQFTSYVWEKERRLACEALCVAINGQRVSQSKMDWIGHYNGRFWSIRLNIAYWNGRR